MEVDGDLQTVLSEQCHGLMAVQAVESDLNFAFQLQMQEAIDASLSSYHDVSLPSSSNPTLSNSDAISGLLPDEISYYEQQMLDHQVAETEMKKIHDDLNRSIHDHAFALELQNVPEEEWMEKGDIIEKPYSEGSVFGRGVAFNHEDSFRVYVKGLIREEEVKGLGSEGLLAGIGVAICDTNDCLVLEVSKGIVGGEMCVEVAEVKAVIEGLNVAIMLGLMRIVIVSCCNFTCQCVTGKTRPSDSNMAALFDQVTVVSRKLSYCGVSRVEEKDLKFALRLAQDAIAYQARQALGNNSGKNAVETCAICLENTTVDHMFQIHGCSHRYCFSCMRTYVQFKLLQSMLPKCPHEGCVAKLRADDCKKFLTPELFDVLCQRVMEASIDLAEKIYCPYPACSVLMSKSESPGGSGGNQASVRMCTKCHRHFCINCKVPWHENMTCLTYKQLNPHLLPEDSKLRSLAADNRWRQCPKCNHMVSLVEGCNHIYCRCGHEFCYVCGAEWRKKKATCNCPLWDERNIIRDPNIR